MSHILNVLKGIINKRDILFFLAVLFFLSNAKAQFSGYAGTARTTWDGPYDIKMIGAPNLEAVYVNPAGKTNGNLLADSIVRQATIMRLANLIEFNNDYKGGSPFKEYDNVPKSAFLCGDPETDADCIAGLIVTTGTCASGSIKYNGPDKIDNVLLSMSYSDYDGDNSTFSSSMAQLDISSCSEIQAAYLYWAGMLQGSNDALVLIDGLHNSYTAASSGVAANQVFNVSASSGIGSVKLKIPGSVTYQSVSATAANTVVTGNKYLCFADVTTLVQGTGGGQFWLGNVQSYPIEGSGGSSSGWALVVVFRSPLSPPRRISLWDGFQPIGTTATNIMLTGLLAPATTNFKSYVGFGALDAEDLAPDILGTTPVGIDFQTNGGSTYTINPFDTDQPHYKLYKNNGMPSKCNGDDNVDACKKPIDDGNICLVYDGIASSHITTYNEVTDKNGNEIVRLPSNTNTLGFDLAHMKLPNGAVAPSATSATIKLKSGDSGGYDLFLAYIAIERLQPKLVMTKTANVNTVATGGTITYTLRVTNVGNTASTAGDKVYDTLDVATTFGSYTPASGVTVATVNGNHQFTLPSIAMNAFIDIVFTVNVLPYAGNTTLYDAPSCKRTITNTAWAEYTTTTSGVLKNKSNSDDCGIGEETRVLITGFTPPTPTVISANSCTYATKTVIEAIRTELDAQSGITTAMLDLFDIRKSNNVRVQSEDSVNDVVTADMPFIAYRDITAGACQQVFQINFTGSCVLPVELISFTGWRKDDVNILRWLTAAEKDNAYFIIEKSINGTDFIAIGRVEGNGNSSGNTYRFNDNEISEGTAYYRLKQVDYNGKFSYSNTIVIDNAKRTDINIYPNPNNGSFTINLLAPEQSYKLDITDVEGREVYAISGDEVPSTIEVNHLAKGLYIVRFYLDNNVIVKKLVVY